MNWKRLLAKIAGSVDQELFLRNEFFVTVNCLILVLGIAAVAAGLERFQKYCSRKK
jgi:hypothetical protein